MTLRNYEVRKSLIKLKAVPSRNSVARKPPSKKDTFSNDNAAKRKLIEIYSSQSEKLQQKQCKYRKLLTKNVDVSKVETLQRANAYLLERKDNLKASLFVANNVAHRQKTQHSFKCIKSHITCQEKLLEEIKVLKKAIRNMEREVSIQDKRIFEHTRLMMRHTKHTQTVLDCRKKLQLLENHLENEMGRECLYTAENDKFRAELVQLINERTRFNDTYSKLVQQLTSDKKYLFELIEYAMLMYDNCIDFYDKIKHSIQKDRREQLRLHDEYQIKNHNKVATDRFKKFMDMKQQVRTLADIEPREQKRREAYIAKNFKRFEIYNKVFDKLCQYTGQNRMQDIIDKYKEQESLYYSYFTYANEMGYHMTLLNASCNKLLENVRLMRNEIRNSNKNQISVLIELEGNLQKKQKKTDELQQKSDSLDNNIETLYQDICEIYETLQLDASPLLLLLAPGQEVNMEEMRYFLKKLEERLLDVLAYVYCTERENEEIDDSEIVLDDGRVVSKHFLNLTVTDSGKYCDWTTKLNDIVLAQQCPECAVGDTFVGEKDDGIIFPHTTQEARESLYEKVVQPDMQYRLHDIDKCRLPRSRIIAAKLKAFNCDY